LIYLISNPKFNSSLEWFEWAKSDVKRLRESPRGEEAMMGVEESPIKMAGRLIRKRVKNHPTLEIYFRNRQVEALPYCPPNFTGLNIWAAHSGSEGLIDLIQFKPEMNAYLDMLEIGYTDKSSIIR